MSIRRKILLFSSISLVCTLLVIHGSIFILFQNILYDNDVKRLALETRAAVEATNRLIAEGAEAELNALLRAYLPQNGMIRIITNESEALLTISTEAAMQKLPTAFQTNEYETIRDFFGRYEIVIDENTEKITSLKLVQLSERDEAKERSPSREMLTETEAIEIALTEVNGRIDNVEIDEEDGLIIYEVEIEVAADEEATVIINAYTGDVLSVTFD